ncbi:MAG: DUF6455 family protein [Methyloceanibacter sp.]
MANSKLLWPSPDEERQRQELMDQMMQVRGVDVVAASQVDGGLALLEAIGKCRLCGDERACRHWLAREPGSTPQDFCPNADFFGTLLKTPD